MGKPPQWRDYPCDDYFSSPLAQNGCWDEPCQLWLIEPSTGVEEDVQAEFLQVGRPGVDSIGFGYRKNTLGFWAFHRMVDRHFQYLAPSVQAFLDGWAAGQIKL
jgi:hypothetical protein